MRRRVFQASILALLLAPLACSLLVDLKGLSGDGGVDASVDASLDTATDHAVEAEAATVDANLDAGPDVTCATPLGGGTISIAPGGLAQPFFSSGPIVSGDYIVTSGAYWCFGCKGSSGVVIGGVHVTVSGADVAIERRIDFNYASQQIRRLDRWHGTFDQLNRKLTLTEDCPEAGASAGWFTYLAVAADGGSLGQLEMSFPDVQGADLDSGVPIDLALYFTKK